MRNRIKNLANSHATMSAMLVIVCCMLLTAVQLKLFGEWTGLAVAGSLVGGITLFAWLAWSTYVLCAGKTVREMQPKPRFFMETLIYILTLGWVYAIRGSWLILIPFVCLFAWYLYAEFRNAFIGE